MDATMTRYERPVRSAWTSPGSRQISAFYMAETPKPLAATAARRWRRDTGLLLVDVTACPALTGNGIMGTDGGSIAGTPGCSPLRDSGRRTPVLILVLGGLVLPWESSALGHAAAGARCQRR